MLQAPREFREHFGRAAQLSTLAIAGQGLFYGLSVLLARRLGVNGFEAYSVAIAAVLLLASLSTLGLEKYALRVVPSYVEHGDWARAMGYVRFGLRRTLWASLLLAAALGLGWNRGNADSPAAAWLAVGMGCLALPAVALVQYGVEVLSAFGDDVRATAIYRVAVPAAALVFVGLALHLPVEMGGVAAVACWGAAWALGLAMMAFAIRRATPPAASGAAPREEAGKWQREALPFVGYSLSLTFVTQCGVIAMDRFQPDPAAVGAYAAAAATANLVVVLATATNRFYSPRLSMLLEQRDFAGALQLRRERLAWLLPAVGVFLVLSFGFGREILALFRPEFVEQGAAALRILAASAAFTVLFSLAPTYLKYVKRNRLVLGTVAGAAAAQGALLVLLVPRFEATGAAVSYAVAMCGMYTVFSWMAIREVKRMRADQGAGGASPG